MPIIIQGTSGLHGSNTQHWRTASLGDSKVGSEKSSLKIIDQESIFNFIYFSFCVILGMEPMVLHLPIMLYPRPISSLLNIRDPQVPVPRSSVVCEARQPDIYLQSSLQQHGLWLRRPQEGKCPWTQHRDFFISLVFCPHDLLAFSFKLQTV